MPRPRIAMRKIREVLRLGRGEGLSPRQVGASLALPRISVRRYLERAHLAGVSWPLPEGMDDQQLERWLYAPPPPPGVTRPLPDWSEAHQELRRKDVTLQLLWLEYKEGAPDGYQYSQFCRRYREWQRHVDVVMRQEHRAGEKLFVDWPGATVPIVNPITGVITPAQIFVAVLGASNYLYAEAFPAQELAHWIAGHVHAFEFFGCVPRITVCDNLRAGVTRAHRYEPLLNATYREMAAWYGVAIMPTRAYKPRDKAKVEAGVLIVERWILARLRHRTFFSLAELNDAIRELVSWLNERPFKKLDGCRRSLFEELERPAKRALPGQRYEYADWSVAKGQHRLPHRGRPSLLLGPLPAGRRAGRGQVDGLGGGGLPAPPPGGQPPARLHSRPPHHRPRPHAGFAPAPSRMDPQPHRALGGEDRALDCRAGPRRHGVQAAPRAGLPRLPGHPSPRQALRGRAPGGGLATGAGHPGLQLPLGRIDLEDRARPPSPAHARARRPTPPPRERARRHLLPVTRRSPCSPRRLSTSSTPST